MSNFQCKNCNRNFHVQNSELNFYKDNNLPTPQECPDCREQKRISWRNEKKLYRRTCESCRKQIISNISEDKPYHVYCPECWWSDKWDPIDVGQEFDFSRPFFEQFDELLRKSKLISLFGKNNENSDYVNHETDDKNCYLNAGGHFNEDSFYNTYSLWGKDTVDNYWVSKCELTYMCIHCENCYHSEYLQDCKNCSNCMYSRDLIGCDNCFGCIGLNHKKYCLFNEQLSEEEYKQKVANLLDENDSYSLRKKSYDNFIKYPHRNSKNFQCENVTGDNLTECKNTYESHLIEKAEDARYCYIGADIKDSMDLSSFGWGELNYNVASSINCNNVVVASAVTDISDSQYCFMCFNSNNLFGCIGLNRKKYCILNKQYTKEEYFELVPKIIEHMKQTGEYGNFFPIEMSPLNYNETIANEYFPMTREEATSAGYSWKEYNKKEYLPQTYTGSYKISQVTEDISDEILSCKQCSKNYKILKPELEFYKKMNIDIPIKCPECRHYDRFNMRNPRKLWDRTCDKCGKKIVTSYSPDRPEIVYCEDCYAKEVF